MALQSYHRFCASYIPKRLDEQQWNAAFSSMLLLELVRWVPCGGGGVKFEEIVLASLEKGCTFQFRELLPAARVTTGSASPQVTVVVGAEPDCLDDVDDSASRDGFRTIVAATVVVWSTAAELSLLKNDSKQCHHLIPQNRQQAGLDALFWDKKPVTIGHWIAQSRRNMVCTPRALRTQSKRLDGAR